MKQLHDSRGFTIIEAVVLFAIAALIVSAGWIVYDRNKQNGKDEPQTSEITNFDQCVAAGNPVMESYPEQCAANGKTFTRQIDTGQNTQPSDETAGWLLYESPGGEYSLRLADGWNLTRYQKSSSIYTFNNSDLVLETGTKAVITEVDGGGDGRTGLFINYASQNIDQIVTPGTKQTPLTTNDGLEVEKYYWIVSGYSNDGGLGIGNGDTQYTYVIRKSADRVMTIDYSFQPGSTDYHNLVEKVVKTIHFKSLDS